MHKIIFFLFVACGYMVFAQTADSATEEWKISQPALEGFNPAELAETVRFIEQDSHKDFRSLIITRNGKLIAEHYFNGHGADALLDIRSTAKSITATLIGIALSEGVIPDIHTPVLSLFPSYMPVAHNGPNKQAITIEHLLTMTSGLDADVNDSSSPGHEDYLWEAEDWIRFALDLPMAHSPGEVWSYASVNTFLLGAAVEVRTGKNLAQYANDRLFGPLGITQYRWTKTPKGRIAAQGSMAMRARDMAKLGQLYLNNGQWMDTQIVPAPWIQTSLVGRYSLPWAGYDLYGYGWYTHTLTIGEKTVNYFLASGNGGNKIYFFPETQIVVVIQSAAYNTSYGQRRSLEILKQVLAALNK